MFDNNLSTTIIRLAFAKGADQIHVGLTKKGNKTFVGEIVYSEELTISHYNKLFNVEGNSVVGSVGTICVADDEEANNLIEQIESIQAARPVNARGNKYPFVFLRVATNGSERDIIFNKGVNGEKHRLTFLEVECVEVEADAPDEVVGLESPQFPQLVNSRSNYGTVRYRPQTKAPLHGVEAQTKAAIASANIASAVPSFNTKTIEAPQVEETSQSLDSQQDKLNAIAVAMKAAGMSGAEIAQALKAELELVF